MRVFHCVVKKKELFPYDQSYRETKNHQERLWRTFEQKNNVKWIGSGVYASVYTPSRESDVVFKVGVMTSAGRGDSKCKNPIKHDDPYLTYLEKIVLPHQGNPLVPKIHWIKYVSVINKHNDVDFCGYVVAMEKLQPLPNAYHRIEQLLAEYGATCTEDFEFPKEIARKDTTGHFKQIAVPLRKLLRRFSPDIHEGNVMLRKVGGVKQVVITDPVA